MAEITTMGPDSKQNEKRRLLKQIMSSLISIDSKIQNIYCQMSELLGAEVPWLSSLDQDIQTTIDSRLSNLPIEYAVLKLPKWHRALIRDQKFK